MLGDVESAFFNGVTLGILTTLQGKSHKKIMSLKIFSVYAVVMNHLLWPAGPPQCIKTKLISKAYTLYNWHSFHLSHRLPAILLYISWMKLKCQGHVSIQCKLWVPSWNQQWMQMDSDTSTTTLHCPAWVALSLISFQTDDTVAPNFS